MARALVWLRQMRYMFVMTTPAGMTDLFPAFSLGAVALVNLMARLEPPMLVRNAVVSALALILGLYLFGELHLYLPDSVGLPALILLSVSALAIITWNWISLRAEGRGQ